MRVIDHLSNSLSREEFYKATKYFNDTFLEEKETASKALLSAFIFSNTDEGFEYWDSIYCKLFRKDHPELIAKEVKTYDVHIPSYFTLNQKQIASLFEHKKAKKKLLEWFADKDNVLDLNGNKVPDPINDIINPLILEKTNETLSAMTSEIFAKNDKRHEMDFSEEKEEKEFVTDFEVGKWYWSERFKWLFNYKGENNAFGFNWNIWHECYGMTSGFNFTPATPEQIKEALVNEAKKRGFIDIDLLKMMDQDGTIFKKGMFTNCGNKFTYHSDIDCLELDGVEVYFKGKWATIL